LVIALLDFIKFIIGSFLFCFEFFGLFFTDIGVGFLVVFGFPAFSDGVGVTG
jgi:hypothetical protein